MAYKLLLFLGISCLPFLSPLRAETHRGSVKDNATGLPIAGAHVRAGDAVVSTDALGAFEVALEFSRKGATPLSLQVSDSRYCQKTLRLQEPPNGPFSITLQAARQRLIVTTDIGGADPDDEQSLVHLLVCSNTVQLEGLVCGLAWDDRPLGMNVLNAIVQDYGRVYENLKVHAEGFPLPAYLASIATHGQVTAGMKGVGKGKDSPGSELIIQAVDREDPRPVWINAWGGNNTLAQALWKVLQTRSPAEVARFVEKLRVYDVLGQDDAGAWMVKTFPHLVYIRSKAVYGWAPDDAWVAQHVQNKGPLGLRYRSRIWAIEGDSPAFMHVLANGVNDPNQIDQGGWGGRFSEEKRSNIRSMDFVEKSGLDEMRFAPYEMLSDSNEGVGTVNRWRSAIYNDLAARMLWSTLPKFSEANHHPRAILNQDSTLQGLVLEAKVGDELSLDASASDDPDGNELTYSWTYYKEAGSYPHSLEITNPSQSRILLRIPRDAAGSTLHLLLEVRDNGSPSLSSFRRVIIRVT